jgi:PAS domain S-box-containing protein
MALREILGARAGSVHPSTSPSDPLPDRAGPAGAGVAEYDSRTRVSTLRLLRAGSLLVIIYQLIFLNLDARVSAPIAHVLELDLAGVALGAIGFGLTYGGWFAGRWRPMVLLIGAGEIFTATAAAALLGDPIRMFVTVILYSLGAASLVPWHWYWQQSFNLAGLVSLVVGQAHVAQAFPYAFERWLAVLVAAAIGQCATVFAELHRRELRQTMMRLDQSQERLGRESDERGRAIAELKQAREELRASEERFELFMKHVPGLVFMRDANGRYMFVNAAAYAFGGIDAQQWIGKTTAELGADTDETDLISDTDRMILETGAPAQIVERVMVGGKPRHFLVTKFPIPDRSGRPAILGGVSIDVTDRMRAEQALKESEELFRSLVENAMDIVLVIQPDGIVKFNSPSLERISGWTPAEIIDQSGFDSVHPDDLPEVANGLRQALESSSSFQMARFRVRNKDGSWRVWEASGRGLPGDPPRVLVNARDVTERVQLEEQLTAARDAALEASRLKSAFLANVSHEIRTPLYIILGYSEYIAQRVTESGDHTYQAQFDAIARAGKRLLTTIQGILDLSRIEARAFDLHPAAIELAPMVERMTADLRVLAEAKGLELGCTIEAEGSAVRFDEYCLTNALSNLLQNAIKFTDRGRVDARVYRDADGHACVDVRDTGVGIAPEYLPRLFEPFSQERGPGSHRAEGAGLGLALTRRYLELNHAWLTVESRKGEGSTFTIHFADDAASSAAAESVENPFYASAERG